MAGAIDFIGNTYRNARRPIVAKTANYTVLPKDNGVLFTNEGASGAVTFTLPTPAARLKGMMVEFFIVADQTVTLTCATSDRLVVANNASADSLAFSTSSEKIGASLKATCSGSLWLVQQSAYDAQTATITDS